MRNFLRQNMRENMRNLANMRRIYTAYIIDVKTFFKMFFNVFYFAQHFLFFKKRALKIPLKAL